MSESAPRMIDPTARWKTLSILAIFAVVAVGVVLSKPYFEGRPTLRMAEDVVFKDRQGHDVRLADYRGKIVLMNFWATWCGPCVEETPSFDRLARTLKAKNVPVVILAASLDTNGWSDVDPFLKRMHVGDLPVVLDSDASQAAKFGTFKLPETWVISRDGHKLKRYVGATNWDDPAVLDEIQRLDRDLHRGAS